MLSVNNIYLVYNQPVLNGISFSVAENEIIGIAGNSGAGKTSLLKIIAGLADATEGTVYLNNKRVVGPSMKLIPGHPDIQLVNQDFDLDIYQTTEENIKGKILHLPKTVQEQFTAELLELMELTHASSRLAHTLSGGEQQRLAIARALALEPTVLLLDEPFVHLDAQLRYRLISYLTELKRVRNMSIIIVSHNSEELLSLSDKIIYLKDGIIKRLASPFEFYYNYTTVSEARMFGLINQLTVAGKSVHFRPDEYEIDDSEHPEIPLNYSRSVFMGSYFLNEFNAGKKKKIVLLHKAQLNNVKGITINKRKK
ncbi:MAG: ATP-binding cassette domain-containing protein [Crocinitomicaceae bacterium]|nr:ATP-binding cassette domain-containing protein [Crocinitomicaceae bacterium]NGF75899.1 ATP-binding cassette domain-containing protein [Fluviicola sp. SGL-29]